MSEKYKIRDPEGMYFVTMTVVFWIDLFESSALKHIIVNTLKHYQNNKGLVIHAWCLMSSHVHMIISSRHGYHIPDFLRGFKKYTNREIIRMIKTTNGSRKDWLIEAFFKAGKDLKRISKYKIWQDGNHPIELISNKFIDQKLDYILNNPVESEIVDEPHYYLYGSARDYAGIKGLLDVELIE